jgi:hypothetical protein
MRHINRAVTLSLLVALTGVTLGAACAPHRYYDPYYSDYHPWDRDEMGYYTRWEYETRRPHEYFERRSRGEQREYYSWRHEHGDGDRNYRHRDRDRDHERDRDNH